MLCVKDVYLQWEIQEAIVQYSFAKEPPEGVKTCRVTTGRFDSMHRFKKQRVKRIDAMVINKLLDYLFVTLILLK